MIIEIQGKRVEVPDSFKDLSPEDQQAQVDRIANQMASGQMSEEEQQEYDVSRPIGYGAIGATTGAAVGPYVGKAVDTAATAAAQKTLGPEDAKKRAISNWLKTQTTGPDVGGATYKEAFKKSETARGVPIQSRGSQIPIRKGFLGIENQPAPPSLPQKAAANILSGEKLGTPSVARRIGGMGVMGAEAGKTISDLEQGNIGDAAVSGLGTIGGALSQSRIAPLRAVGTGLSLLTPAYQGGKELYRYFFPEKPREEEPQEKAAGGLMSLAGGRSVNEEKPFVGYPQIKRSKKATEAEPQVDKYTGMLDALMGGSKRENLSVFDPKQMQYSEAYDKYEPLGIALMGAPFLGGPIKSMGKALAPKAGQAAEDLLARQGLISYAAPKAKMSPSMSFGKTLDETTQPSGRLVSSLANKFGYDEAKLAQDYPQTLFPILEKDKTTGKLFAGKATHPEAEAIKKARMFAQKEIAKGDYEPYFDITKRSYVDPAQYPLSGNTLIDAIPKTPDTIAKYEAIAKNPDALARWQKGFDIGSQRPLAKDWYAMKQLQDEFIRVLGPEEGVKQFKARFADPMGATTGGADPTSNLMTAAYTNVMRQRGMDIPTEGFDVPYPVYGRFLGQNLEQAKKLHETGGLSAATQPKRHNFSGNFLGHRDLSTLDEQMMSAYVDPKTKKPFTSPPGGAYGLFQRELNDLADKNKVLPANFQDVTWAGLKDYPGKPMIQEINELLHRTSRIGGITQKEALENLIRADKPVYKEGGSTTPAWQRKEGKSPSGGLNALGRASYKRETGGELKAPQPEGGSRKKSFCARMGGMKKKLTSSKTANDPDSRINKALRKWKC